MSFKKIKKTLKELVLTFSLKLIKKKQSKCYYIIISNESFFVLGKSDVFLQLVCFAKHLRIRNTD